MLPTKTTISFFAVVWIVTSAILPVAADDVAQNRKRTPRGLGLILASDTAGIVIHAVRPGSVAEKSNSLAAGARLSAVKVGNKKTSLVRKSPRDLANLIRGASHDAPDITIWFTSKHSRSTSQVTLRRPVADIDHDSNVYRLQIDEQTTIEQVLQEFNRRAKHHSIGRVQPPITTDEVIELIRGLDQNQHDSWTDEVFQKFQTIAETRRIPAGSEMSTITRCGNTDGLLATVWWVDLKIATGQGKSNGFRIRNHTISMRPMTVEEKAEQKQSNAALGELFHHLPKD